MSSGSDLADELLQAAGQSGRNKKGSSSKRKRKVDSDSDDDISLDEESDWEPEELAAVSKKKTNKHSRKKQNNDDDDDVAAINEDDLIADEEDRQRLAAMTEFEREMELANRAEQRQQEIQRQKIIRAAQGDVATEKQKSSRSAPARRSGREIREENSKKSAMEELKAARERKARGEKASRVPAHDREHDEDDEDEDDVEEGEQKQQLWHPRDDAQYDNYYSGGGDEDEASREEAQFDDVKGIQVRRHRLEDWFTKPFFAEALAGSIVRLAGGEIKDKTGRAVLDPQTNRPQMAYFLAQVIGIEELPAGRHKYLQGGGEGWKTPYPFGSKGEKTFMWLRVVRGKSERRWPMMQVSNSSITEDEYERWQKVCKETQSVMTVGQVNEVKKRLVAADTYVYTAKDVARMVEEKRAKGRLPANAALEKARLERDLAAAREAGEESKAAELGAALQRLEAATSRRGGSTSMAELNRKNAGLNFQAALKSDERGGGGGATGVLDPFSRRATRPMVYWNTRGIVADGVTDAAEDEEDEARDGRDGSSRVAVDKEEGATLVDLSGLDLSAIEGGGGKWDVLQRKLLGAKVQHITGMEIFNNNNNNNNNNNQHPRGQRTVSWAEYKKRNNLLTLK